MASNPSAVGLQTATNTAFPFALRSGCSDGKAWPEEQYKTTQRLPIGNPKYQEYYFKLGGFLRDQLFYDAEHQGRTYFLKELPTSYHVRYRQRNENGAIDYYIYGHPTSDRSGNPRPFNSPNEFFPHLLWLIGGSGDKSLCSCKLCNKTKPKPEPTALKAKISVAVPVAHPPQLDPMPGLAPSVTPSGPQPTAMKRTPSASSTSAAKPPPAPKPITQPPVPVQATAPTPVHQPQIAPNPAPPFVTPTAPPIAPAQPRMDLPSQEGVIFRVGEVVWFKNNNAWRLGIVIQTAFPDQIAGMPLKIQLQPLAYTLLKLETVLKVEADLKPFLAFSVPKVATKDLQDRRMSELPWQRLHQIIAGDRPRLEQIALDSSKMAAMEVDKSFSTFNSIVVQQPNVSKQYVGGIFLGAERISVYEAVRVRLTPYEWDPAWPRNLPIVLVLREIYIMGDGPHFFGDIYRLEETANPQEAPHQNQLPLAMQRERIFRNRLKAATGTRYDWTLIHANQDKAESTIRGRFYETERLMPILDNDRFQAGLEKGIVDDVQNYLNNRLESAGPYLGRRKNRMETVSAAVPDNFHLPLAQEQIVEDL
ncbi:hypothetical protein BX600DRAFT_504921 [Xylariales sp. PMI_506]|nr:hypothetical protein BX600DRAFT_504921 [Xylariales sp. PMI_506]